MIKEGKHNSSFCEINKYIKAQCVINITNGSLGNRFVYTKYENCTINVSTKLQLVGQIDFKNCVFNMGTNAEINMHKPIKSGAITYRNRVTLENCILDRSIFANEWTGINVAAGSYLRTISSTKIRRAFKGVNGAFQSNCYISETSFEYCGIGINFPNLDSRFAEGSFAQINLSGFSGNKFQSCNIGIKLVNVALLINIGLNAQLVNQFNGGLTGISVENSKANIENCKFDGFDIQIDIANNLSNDIINTTSCSIKGLGNSITAFNEALETSIRVRGNWQQVNITNAKFVNLGYHKSIDIENINNGNFNITGNRFEYNYNSGLEGAIISVKNSSGVYFSSISENTFIEPSGGFSFSIQLVNLNSQIITVSENKLYGNDIFDINHNKIGEVPSQKTWCSFHAENCNNVLFLSNTINLMNDSRYNNPWTMHQMIGNSGRFESNTVTNSSTTNRESIRLEGMIEDEELCHNTVKNSFKGILIVNNSPGCKIKNNTIIGDGATNNNQLGIVVLGNVPSQIHEGNNWEGGKFQYEAFLSPQLLVDDKINRFISRIDNYNLSPKYWPTLVNRSNWFRDDKSVVYPNNCSIRPIPPPCMDYDYNLYLSDSTYRSSLSQGELWDNDSYFYKYYSNYSGCLISTNQINLFNSISSGNLPDYIYIQNRIEDFYKIDSSTQNYIDTHKNLFDSLSIELSILINEINPDDTTVQDSNYQINSLEGTLMQIQVEIDSTLSRIDTMRLIEISNLFSSVENLDSYSSYDSLYKVYYYLQVKKINNDTFTEQEYDFLYNLSRLCPNLYGNLTYKANAMLSSGDNLESLTDNCAMPILLNEEKTNRSNIDCDISLYPIPIVGNNELTFLSKCPIHSFNVIDILGKELLRTEYSDNNSIESNTLKVSELNLNRGVYIVVINLKNGSSIQKRILIN